MKNIFLTLSLIFSVSAFAHENPPQKGMCFLVKKGIPDKPAACTYYSGGGSGEFYNRFKVGKTNILIEYVDGDVGIGNNQKNLKDGESYMRDIKTLKRIPYNENDFPKYFCTRQLDGDLDVCSRGLD